MNIIAARKSNVESRSAKCLAFTLVEVVVAVGIFFMAMFAILGVLSQCVRSVSSLQKDSPTAGMVAAMAMANTKWEEGSDSGDFGDFYPDYTWETQTNLDDEIQPGQDGAQPPVFKLQIIVKRKGELSSALEIVHYSPDSPVKSGHKF
jgi:type II secretory pathway pseudopilin PulG